MVEGTRCPYGCVPSSGLLSDKEGFLLLGEALEIGGRGEPLDLVQLAEMFDDDPRAMREIIRRMVPRPVIE